MFDDCGRCEDDATPVRRVGTAATGHVTTPPSDVAGLVPGARTDPPIVNSVDALLARLVSPGDDDLF